MAGKTLPGIGDDESGEHELAADASDLSGRSSGPSSGPSSGLSSSDASGPVAGVAVVTRPMDIQVPKRGTDRMPLSTLFGAPAFVDPTPPTPPTSLEPIDEDKVAEGLKKLRSLDEPLGPIPTTLPPSTMPAVSMPVSPLGASSMPTIKEGMPAVSAASPAPVTPALTAAELIRSRGTSHGHALSVSSKGQGLIPVMVDDRLKGTLLGHSLHLPEDGPEGGAEGEPREVRLMAQVAQVGRPVIASAEIPADFSHGDAGFFDSEPVNTELEPERASRGTLVARGAIFVAVISVFVVAAVAWVKVHNKNKEEAAAAAAQAAQVAETAAAAPPTPVNAVAPAPTEAVAAPAPAVVPTPVPTPAATVEAAKGPATETTESPTAKLQRELATAEAARAARAAAATEPGASTSAHTSTHSSRPPESHHTTAGPRPAAPGKALKPVDDPDGTLPLTE